MSFELFTKTHYCRCCCCCCCSWWHSHQAVTECVLPVRLICPEKMRELTEEVAHHWRQRYSVFTRACRVPGQSSRWSRVRGASKHLRQLEWIGRKGPSDGCMPGDKCSVQTGGLCASSVAVETTSHCWCSCCRWRLSSFRHCHRTIDLFLTSPEKIPQGTQGNFGISRVNL